LEENSMDGFLGNEGVLVDSQNSEDSVETIAYDSQESADSVDIHIGTNSHEPDDSEEAAVERETSAGISFRSECSVDSALVHPLGSEDTYVQALVGNETKKNIKDKTGNSFYVRSEHVSDGTLAIGKEGSTETKTLKIEDRTTFLELQLPPSSPLSLTSEVPIEEKTEIFEFPSFSPEVLADFKYGGGFGNRKESIKKRRRVEMACDRCHIRKTKCDGRMPCSNCKRSSKVCLYHEAKTRRDENLAKPPSARKRLADSVNKHRGESCTRTSGCLRPLRHPGHCRTGPGRNRKRK